MIKTLNKGLDDQSPMAAFLTLTATTILITGILVLLFALTSCEMFPTMSDVEDFATDETVLVGGVEMSEADAIALLDQKTREFEERFGRTPTNEELDEAIGGVEITAEPSEEVDTFTQTTGTVGGIAGALFTLYLMLFGGKRGAAAIGSLLRKRKENAQTGLAEKVVGMVAALIPDVKPAKKKKVTKKKV